MVSPTSQQTILPSNILSAINDDNDVGVLEASIQCAETSVINNGDIFIVEAANTLNNDQDHIVIEGVKTVDKKRRAVSVLLLGCLALASAAAAVVAMISSRISLSDRQSMLPTIAPMIPGSNSTIENTTINHWNENRTIADALIDGHGSTILMVPGGRLFIELINRTDTNFTYFGVMKGLELPEGDLRYLVSKLVSLLWSCHLLDMMKSCAIQGQVIQLEDMYDGLVLTSMAGYPLKIQLDPFRMNNVTIKNISSQESHYKNGIIYSLNGYPSPVVPWIGKTLYDILQELNNHHGGDLSGFIALIDAMPDLFGKLNASSFKATTLFVPTNEALALLDPTLLEEIQGELDPTIQQLVLNHVVDGNFAKSCWSTTSIGSVISSTELRLKSQSGQDLNLTMNDKNVIINGDARIIQEDIFSEDGIIQIIDKVLVLT